MEKTKLNNIKEMYNGKTINVSGMWRFNKIEKCSIKLNDEDEPTGLIIKDTVNDISYGIGIYVLETLTFEIVEPKKPKVTTVRNYATQEEMNSWVADPTNFLKRPPNKRINIIRLLFGNDYLVQYSMGIILTHKETGNFFMDFNDEFKPMFIERLQAA